MIKLGHRHRPYVCSFPKRQVLLTKTLCLLGIIASCLILGNTVVFASQTPSKAVAAKAKKSNQDAKLVSKASQIKSSKSKALAVKSAGSKASAGKKTSRQKTTALHASASKSSVRKATRSKVRSNASSKAKVQTVVKATPTGVRNVALKNAHDPLALNSSVALVADADSEEVLYAKNPHVVLPIASITKLMTVLVNLEAHVDLDEVVTISTEDIDTYKNTHSRLIPGTQFTRRELMHLALMASENRAASALGRSYPGGMYACVQQMNRRAKQLGMISTHFDETTGLSVANRSSANDLARLVLQARRYSLIRQFSTDPQAAIETSKGVMNFRNTNRLVRAGEWDIQLQKTGFINEAGRCLVMQARVGGRNLVIVLLDALGSSARSADAERIRKFVLAKL